MPLDHGSVAHIEHVKTQRVFVERVFLDILEDVERPAHSWRGWFGSWESLREGDELNITLEDGRAGRAVVERVRIDIDLVDPLVRFVGTTPLA